MWLSLSQGLSLGARAAYMPPMLKIKNLTATVGEEAEAKTILNGVERDPQW